MKATAEATTLVEHTDLSHCKKKIWICFSKAFKLLPDQTNAHQVKKMTPVMVQWLKVQTKEAMLDVAWG